MTKLLQEGLTPDNFVIDTTCKNCWAKNQVTFADLYILRDPFGCDPNDAFVFIQASCGFCGDSMYVRSQVPPMIEDAIEKVITLPISQSCYSKERRKRFWQR